MARRAYPPELRRRVVDLAEGGRKVAEVAVEFEVGKQTIYAWSRMQVELLDRKRWKKCVELSIPIFEYLEVFHNRRRRHSLLGILSLVEYEMRHAS